MKEVIKTAIKLTIPVMVGYLVLGTAFGLLLYKAGFHFLWAFLISLTVYAGSMQFVLISFLQGTIGIVSIVITTLSVNSRHIFYGISFIEKFKQMGKSRPYMIFSLTDETYSLLCSIKRPEGMDEKKLFFFISFFNQMYWILGSVIGGILGDLISFDTSGIEFSMTALFIVIFVEQWLSTKNHLPAYIGLFCGIISLILFGADNFLLPAMVITVIILMGLKNRIVKTEDTKDEV
ncbi:4-azaleucine resistance transporter AzlC [Mobilisporobacter senegalensis]|uniref:4-azaleucine resistance transporter AzlC n=1 Tax=Mobilisporobacter senegalensis TaxID=1329262 RepID=A0A3N1XZQ1_9FIRM|nr:AzlC family ABC transporter permease [Mobilisporobacter senegalensis]ROR31721.1 4-azaleucine resistance transporter AzlC [Mobilisporobacter senegalensis]